MSVAAPRGDMDGSLIRVTDISESYRRQKVFLRRVSGPRGGWDFSHTLLDSRDYSYQGSGLP